MSWLPIDRAAAVMSAVADRHRNLTGVELPARDLQPALEALIDDAVALLAVCGPVGPDNVETRRTYLPALRSADGRLIACIADDQSTMGRIYGPGAVMHVDSDAGCNWYQRGPKDLWELAAEGLWPENGWTDSEKDLAIRAAALAEEVTR